MKKSGFTLVELIIAASILAIGLVIIMRSFFTAENAITATQENFLAMKLLQNKASELEFNVYREKGYLPQDTTKYLDLGVKKGIYTLKTLNLKKDQEKKNDKVNNSGVVEKNQSKKDPVSEVKLSLSWQDHGNNNNESFIIYFENKEK